MARKPLIGTVANNVNTTADDQVTPVAFQFWNDWRNMVADVVGLPGSFHPGILRPYSEEFDLGTAKNVK